MALARTILVPSREQVMQWEKEWDDRGMSVEDDRPEELTVKAESAWSIRTLAINHGIILNILDCFSSPPSIDPYHYRARKRSLDECVRILALSLLCGLSRKWMRPAGNDFTTT